LESKLEGVMSAGGDVDDEDLAPQVPTEQAPREEGESGNEPGDSEGVSVVRNRKVQFRFDACTDELLAKEVLAHNPYEADFGAVGPTWERVADALRVGVDGRRCRERIKLLVKGQKRRIEELERASGIEETISDLDALIDEIITIQESSNAIQAEKKRVEKESAERADKIAEEVRQKAMEGMKPREKRKSTDETTLLSFLEARHAADAETKRQKLALEERRIAHEERRLKLAEERAALDTKERVSIINMLAMLIAKNSNPNTGSQISMRVQNTRFNQYICPQLY
jgi:hypothetical protein